MAGQLVEDANTLSVEQVTGPPDLIVNAIFNDLAELGRYLSLQIGRLPGVTGHRVQVCTRTHIESSQWRLDRLGTHRLDRLGNLPIQGPRRTLRQRDLPLYLALTGNHACLWPRLATETGLSPATVRRRLATS